MVRSGANLDDSMASLGDAADVSIVNLNDESMASDMNTSMAGLDDMSVDQVKRMDNSMASTSDVQVKKVNTSANDSMADTSMAGLSDMSASRDDKVRRVVQDDSMADYSMASLGEDSMAGIDDSGYKPPVSKGGLSEIESESSNSSMNILDGLKREFAEEESFNRENNPMLGSNNSMMTKQ